MDPRRYRIIYLALSQRIADGTYAPGTRLDIGRLADEWDASRDTVQRAIGLLAEDGLIKRWQGLGWFVLPEEERGSDG